MIYRLQFWTLVAGLAAYILTYLYDLPITAADILAGVLFLLGLIGVVPTARAAYNQRRGLGWGDLFESTAFLTLLAGLVGFVIRFYAPDFPYTDAVILSVLVFVVNKVFINSNLRYNGLLDD